MSSLIIINAFVQMVASVIMLTIGFPRVISLFNETNSTGLQKSQIDKSYYGKMLVLAIIILGTSSLGYYLQGMAIDLFCVFLFAVTVILNLLSYKNACNKIKQFTLAKDRQES